MSVVASAFAKAARVSRAELYGVERDAQLPEHLLADARVPFLGFAGSRFAIGGVVVMAINPGGGGDTYQARTPQDSQLIPLIQAFVAASPEHTLATFEYMCSSYAAQVRTWNLWRILGPVLEACGSSLSEVCYLNFFPYRTAGDRVPNSRALRVACERIVQPLLTELAPSLVIALGKKVGGVAQRFLHCPAAFHVVPRTIGDRRVSEEAAVVLQRLRSRAA